MGINLEVIEIWKALGTLFVIAGSLVLLYGTRLFAERRALRTAGPAEGTVIRRVPRPGSPGSRARYRPVVHFHTAAGEPVVFESPTELPDTRCRVGTRLPVLYDGNDPQRARLVVGGWYDVVMTFYLGALVTAGGLVLTLQHVAH